MSTTSQEHSVAAAADVAVVLPPAIVLLMIVRNEEQRITRCLSSLVDTIHGAVIIDTGSTDGTMQQVTAFFEAMGSMPLLLEQHTWKNFGHNRNLAIRRAEEFVRQSEHFRRRRDVYFLLLDADMELDGTIDAALFNDDAYCILQKQRDFTVPGLRLIRCFKAVSNKHWKCFGVTHEAWQVVNSLDVSDPDPSGLLVAQPQTLLLEGVCILDHDDGGHKKQKFIRDIDLLEDYLEFDNPNDSRAMLFLGMSYANLGIEVHAIERARKKELENIELELRKVNPVIEQLTPKGDKVIREWRSPIDPRGGNRMRMEVPEVLLQKHKNEHANAEEADNSIADSTPPPASKLPGYVPTNYVNDVVREYTEEEFIQLFGIDAASKVPELDRVKELMNGITAAAQSPEAENPQECATASDPPTSDPPTLQSPEQSLESQPFSIAQSIQSCANNCSMTGSETCLLPDLPLFLQQNPEKQTSSSTSEPAHPPADTTTSQPTPNPVVTEEDKLAALETFLRTKSAATIFAKSLQWLSARVEFGKIDKDPNNEEVWYAKVLQGRVLSILDRKESACMCFLEAYNMRPHRNESLIELSKMFREKQMYTVASRFASMARQHTNTGLDTLFIENDAYLIDPWLESVLTLDGASLEASTQRAQFMEYLIRRPVMQTHAINTEQRLMQIADILNSIAPDLPLQATTVTPSTTSDHDMEDKEDFAITSIWPTITSYFDGQLVSNIPTMANWYLRGWFLWPQCYRTSNGTMTWLVLTSGDCIRFADVLIFQRPLPNRSTSAPNMCVVRRVSIPYKLPNNGQDLTTEHTYDEESNSITLLRREDALGQHYRVALDSLCFDDCSALSNE